MKNRRRDRTGTILANPNRVLRRCDDQLLNASIRVSLPHTVIYTGNPDHKQNPGDFGLTPPARPRLNATLCDQANVTRKADATRLLRAGAARLLVSNRTKGDFPTLIWAVRPVDDMVFEARLENETLGHYHGYPLPLADPFRQIILDAYRKAYDV